jgi:hypothetical protein
VIDRIWSPVNTGKMLHSDGRLRDRCPDIVVAVFLMACAETARCREFEGVRSGVAMDEWADTCVWDVATRQTSLLCMSASAEMIQHSFEEHSERKGLLLSPWRSESVPPC